MSIQYRAALPRDAAEIHDIYQYYVDHTVATFATVNPDEDEYRHKIESSLYPYWVAIADERVIGFAYAQQLRPKDAYLWDVELTIYLHTDAPKGSGIGSQLYTILLEELTALGFYNAYGVITGSNQGSIRFHQRFGFAELARFPKMGYKHGAWHDVVWMSKTLAPLSETPELPKPFQKN